MKKTLFITLLCFLIRLSEAQTLKPDIIATSGDYYSNTTGSLSWTMGEPIIETYADGNNILTQGFQQSSYSITAVGEVNPPAINVSVYPNPFTSVVNIRNDENKPLRIEALDMQGKTVCLKTIETGEGPINLSMLADEIYLLRVNDEKGKLLATFKIQKIK